MTQLATLDGTRELRSLRRRIAELRALLGTPGLSLRDGLRAELSRLRESFRLLRRARKSTEGSPIPLDLVLDTRPVRKARHRRDRGGYVNRSHGLRRSHH